MQSLTCSSWLLVLYLVPTRVRWKKKCISPKLWCFHPAIPHHLEQSFPTQITRRDTEMMRYCDLLTFFSVPQHTPKFKPRGLWSFCDFQEAREVEESPGGYPWTISQPRSTHAFPTSYVSIHAHGGPEVFDPPCAVACS